MKALLSNGSNMWSLSSAFLNDTKFGRERASEVRTYFKPTSGFSAGLKWVGRGLAGIGAGISYYDGYQYTKKGEEAVNIYNNAFLG